MTSCPWGVRCAAFRDAVSALCALPGTSPSASAKLSVQEVFAGVEPEATVNIKVALAVPLPVTARLNWALLHEPLALSESSARMLEAELENVGSSRTTAEEGASAMDGIKEAIDTFLLYDFFVILFILAWLILGVGVRLSKGNGLSYDEPFLGTWLFLWPWLFQPLLGVHMLATLVSPAIGWAKKKQLLGDDVWQ